MLLLLAVIGIWLRVFPVRESLWVDELHTSWTISAADAAEVTVRAQLGNNSSTYFYCVRMVAHFFGNSEWSLRLVSLVAGTLLIPSTFFVCRYFRCGIAASMSATALVAIDRHACFYACEARPYAAVQLVALAHLLLFTRLLGGTYRLWTWVLWTLTGIAMFHLHCTSAMVVGAEAVACGVLLWLRFPIKIQRRYLLIGFASIGIGMLSEMELIHQLAERRENWSHFVRATRQPLKIFTIFPFHAYLWLPLLTAVFLNWLQRRIGRVGETNEENGSELDERVETAWQTYAMPAVICICWLMVPIISAWLLTETDVARLFFRRYLVASSVALAPLTAMLVSTMAPRPRDARWLAIVVFLISMFAIRPNVSSRVSEDWRSAVQAIETLPSDGPHSPPVILYSGLIEADAWYDSADPAQRAYCEFPLRGAYPIAADRDVIPLPLTIDTIIENPPKLDASVTEAWLLTRSKHERAIKAIQDAVLHSLGSRWRLVHQSPHGRLGLSLLRAGDGDSTTNRHE